MSSTDNRIVQMQFDNKQFESGVKQTMNSLDKLEDSLQLNGATRGMEKVSAESKILCKEMSNVDSAIETVKVQFSALQVAGAVAMTKLTLAAINAGKKINNAIFGQIISGGMSRSQNIEHAKFQLEGLGVAWKDIADDINYGVKDTAYGLDEAAKIASQLVTSYDLTSSGYTDQMSEEMRQNLRAISGVAAMTNSSYAYVGDIFATVSANNKLMMQQVRQLAAQGLPVVNVLAQQMHKTSAQIQDDISKGNISFREFAEAMDNAFGKHAKEANKTFTGALSNMKAALSRIGQKLADPVYENFRKTFNAITPAINAVNDALTPVYYTLDMVLSLISDKIIKVLENENIIQGLQYIALAFYSWIRPIVAALTELGVFTDTGISSMSEKFLEFAKSLQLYGDKAVAVKDIIKGVINVFRIFGHLVLGVFEALSPAFDAIGLGINKTTSESATLFDYINNNYDKIVAIIKVIATFLKMKVAEGIAAIKDVIKKIDWNSVKKLLTSILRIFIVTLPIIATIANIVANIIVFVINNLPNIKNMLVNIISVLAAGAIAIKDFFGSLFGSSSHETDLEVTTDVQEIDAIDKAIEKVDTLEKKYTELGDTIEETGKRTERAVKGAAEATEDLGGNASDAINETKSGITWTDKDKDKYLKQEDNRKKEQASIESHKNESQSAEKGIGEQLKGINIIFDKILDAFNVGDYNIRNGFYKVGDALYAGYMYIASKVKLALDWFILFIDGITNPIKMFQAIMQAVPIALIGVAIGIIRILNAVIGLFELIPQLGKSLARAAKGFMYQGMGKMFTGLGIFMLSLAAFIAVLTFVSQFLDVEKLKAIVGTLVDVAKWLVVLATVIGIIALVANLGNILGAIASLKKGAGYTHTFTMNFASLGTAVLGLGAILAGFLVAAIWISTNAEKAEEAMKIAVKYLAAVVIILGVFMALMVHVAKLSAATLTNTYTVTGGWKSGFKTQGTISPLTQMTWFVLSIVPVIIALAIALKLTKDIPEDQMITAMWTFIGILGILSVFISALMITSSKFVSTAKNFKALYSISLIIVSIAGLLMSIAAAISLLSYIQTLPNASFIGSILTLGIFAAALLAAVSTITYLSKKYMIDPRRIKQISVVLLSASAFLISIAASLAILSVIQMFAPGTLFNSVLALGTITFVIFVTIGMMLKAIASSGVTPQRMSSLWSIMLTASVLIISIAASLAILSVIQMFAPGTLLNSVLSLGGLVFGVLLSLSMMLALIQSTGITPSKMAQVQTIFLTISVLFLAIASSLWILSTINWENFNGSENYLMGTLIFVIGLLGIMAVIGSVAKGIGTIITATIAIAGLLLALAGTLYILSLIPWDALDGALPYLIALEVFMFAMGIVFAVFVGVAAKCPEVLVALALIMGIISAIAAVVGMIALVIYTFGEAAIKVADSIRSIITSMQMLQTLDFNVIKANLDSLFGIIMTLIMMGVMLPVAVIAIGLLGVGFNLLATGLMALSLITPEMVNSAVEGINTLMQSLGTLFSSENLAYIGIGMIIATALSLLAILISVGILALAIGIGVGVVILAAALMVGAALLLVGAIALAGVGLMFYFAADAIKQGLLAMIQTIEEVTLALETSEVTLLDFVLAILGLGVALSIAGLSLIVGGGLMLIGGTLLIMAVDALNIGMTNLLNTLNGNELNDVLGKIGILLNLATVISNVGLRLTIGGALFLVGSGLLVAGGAIFKKAIDIIDEATSQMEEIAERMEYVGECVPLGLISGITSGAPAVLEAMVNLGTSSLSAFNDAMGIHSPSEKMRESGHFIMAGICEGIEDKWPNLAEGLATIASLIPTTMNDNLDMESVSTEITNGGATGGVGFVNSIVGVFQGGGGDLLSNLAGITGGNMGGAMGNAMLEQFSPYMNSVAATFESLSNGVDLENVPDSVRFNAIRGTQAGIDSGAIEEVPVFSPTDLDYLDQLNLEDFLQGLGGGGGGSPVTTDDVDFGDIGSSTGSGGSGGGVSTSDLADSIASNSGAGTGINDLSQGGTNINSNNTYNFTQNNYSPKELDRTELYEQTNYQLKRWYGWMQSNV